MSEVIRMECETCQGKGELFQESGAGKHATANQGWVECPDCDGNGEFDYELKRSNQMNIDKLITKMKRDIELKYVYVMMKPDELQTMIDGLESLQRELDEKDDAIAYAMNQIQIKESHIRKLEATREAS